MNRPVLDLLDLAQGPVFRATFALMLLGALRRLVLSLSDAAAAYASIRNRATFWHKLRLRLAWELVPSVVLHRKQPAGRALFAYHTGLSLLSLVIRTGVILVPAFMFAHVHLWERALGIHWPAVPGGVADAMAIVTIVATGALFLGRIYSPILRRMESPWSLASPLVILVPFLTGYLAMHPLMSPFSYHLVMLMHVLSACLMFVMIPFGRLLSCVRKPLTTFMPEAAWAIEADRAADAPALVPEAR